MHGYYFSLNAIIATTTFISPRGVNISYAAAPFTVRNAGTTFVRAFVVVTARPYACIVPACISVNATQSVTTFFSVVTAIFAVNTRTRNFRDLPDVVRQPIFAFAQRIDLNATPLITYFVVGRFATFIRAASHFVLCTSIHACAVLASLTGFTANFVLDTPKITFIFRTWIGNTFAV